MSRNLYGGSVENIDIVSEDRKVTIDSPKNAELNVDLFTVLDYVMSELRGLRNTRVKPKKTEIELGLLVSGKRGKKYEKVSKSKWARYKFDKKLIKQNQEVAFLFGNVELLRLNGQDYENVLAIHTDLSTWNSLIEALWHYGFIKTEDDRSRLKYKDF